MTGSNRPAMPTSKGVPAPVGDASGEAAVLVAQSFSTGLPPLGLDGALALRGGDPRARERLAFELGFGWQPAFRAVVEHAIVRSSGPDPTWFALPPLLLCGPSGVGRTHVARRVAELAGVPHVGLDLSGPGGAGQLRPSTRGPDLLIPSAPVLAMAVARCANPIISVFGAEMLDGEGQAELARMIDPSSAERWVDYACGATVDLRHVSWMIQGHEPGALAPSLLRLLHPVELQWPERHELPLHLAEVLAEAAIDLGVVERVGRRADEAITHLSRRHGPLATAPIYDAAQQWLRANLG